MCYRLGSQHDAVGGGRHLKIGLVGGFQVIRACLQRELWNFGFFLFFLSLSNEESHFIVSQSTPTGLKAIGTTDHGLKPPKQNQKKPFL
jgi:hypothetical protein